MRFCVGIAAVMVFATALGVLEEAEAAQRERLGREDKWRIVVDKVMQPEVGWVTEEWMVKAASDAGFNVFCPREGARNLDAVRQVTAWCQKYGIYHMPWIRGTLGTDGAEADGKRVVWSGGGEQALWSINSDEFWEWTHKYIGAYAQMSAENEHLIGVFLDYENYAAGAKEGNAYSLSYDDVILARFAEAKGMALPDLPLARRKTWLQKKGLHDAFSTLQIQHWRERCRALRQAVNAHNPSFQFCIYPAPGTPFMIEAAYPEWGTEQAPLILADPSTYGRPARFLTQADSLTENRRKLVGGMNAPKDARIHFMYAGGIDPIVQGADPEFCGKNAVAISDVTDGYWIFYEGPKYREDHPEYWKWFTWANGHIVRGNYQAQYEPRETDENWTLDLFDRQIPGRSLRAADTSGKTVTYPQARLRGQNTLFLACRKGQAVEVELKHHPLAKYPSPLSWALWNPGMKSLAAGTIPRGAADVVSFIPTVDGIHVLRASAGGCAYSVLRSNVPVGLYAGQKLSLFLGIERLYFKIPTGMQTFAVTAFDAVQETIRVNVLNARGEQVATGQTDLTDRAVGVKVQTLGHAGEVWSLELTKADEGHLEDYWIMLELDAKLPPTLSLAPEHVFELAQ